MSADQTLAAFLGSKAAEGFVAHLRRAGVINDHNQNAYVSRTGKLNENGRQLVENVLVGKMVGDADLLVDLPQPLVGALARSVPYMVQAEGAGEGFSVREELGHALHAYTEIKNTLGLPKGKKAQAETLRTFKRIQGLREDDAGKLIQAPHPALESPKATAILNTLIQRGGPQQMAKVFRKYAEAATAQEEGGGDLLFGSKKDSGTIFEEAFGRAEDEEAREAKATEARAEHARKLEEGAKAKAEADKNQGGLFG
jgi:hypothetical protein